MHENNIGIAVEDFHEFFFCDSVWHYRYYLVFICIFYHSNLTSLILMYIGYTI